MSLRHPVPKNVALPAKMHEMCVRNPSEILFFVFLVELQNSRIISNRGNSASVEIGRAGQVTAP